MTTTTSPPRPGGPTPNPAGRFGDRMHRPAWLRPAEPEAPDARASRLRLRRRLVRWSLPVVVILLLVAVKLFATVAIGDEARAAYAVGNITGAEEAATRLGFLNVIEPHKAPFALGAARVLAGDFDGARAAFEEALAMAPRDSQEACQIRVNLVLSLEKLGAAATANGRTPEAKVYTDRLNDLVAGAPQGCFQGDAQNSEGQQLKDAQQRTQEQQQRDQQQPQDAQQPAPDPRQAPDQPSQDKQQQLDDRTKDNLQQRQQSDAQRTPSGRSPVDKPW